MAENNENQETTEENQDEGMTIGSKADLIKILTDFQGQMNNIQQTVDKMEPKTSEGESSDDEETPGGDKSEQPDENVDEVDAMLHE